MTITIIRPSTRILTPGARDLRAARRVGEQVKAEARRGAIQAFIRPVTAFWRGSAP